MPNYPWFQSLAVLAGWEARRGERGAALRAFVGPAAFRSAADAGEDPVLAGGLHGRVEGSLRLLRRVAADPPP